MEKISDPQEFVREAVRREMRIRANSSVIRYSTIFVQAWAVLSLGIFAYSSGQDISVFETPWIMMYLAGVALVLLPAYVIFARRESKQRRTRYLELRDQLIESSVVDEKI